MYVIVYSPYCVYLQYSSETSKIFFVTDIDECGEQSDTCDRATQTCVNSKGSFRCIDRKPTCDFGYRYNEDQETCLGESAGFVT